MYSEKLINSLHATQKHCDILGLNYFSSEDSKICDYVIPQIPEIHFNKTNQNSISTTQLFTRSLENLRKYIKEDCYKQLFAIVYTTPHYQLDEESAFVNISYKQNPLTQEINKSGIIKSYGIPTTLYETDIITLVHEHIHVLKDTNYYEYQNAFVTGEVLPIFFEIINYERSRLKRMALSDRLQLLYRSKEVCLYIKEKEVNLKSSQNESSNYDIYDFAKGYAGVYLNSFYYALILYDLYKKDPIKILKLISKVLNHQITTLELLNKLNIYCDIKSEIFEKEIKKIQKVLIP